MAILSDAARVAGANDLMTHPSLGALGAVTKGDLRAAFNAIDQFFSDNAATVNAAIPQPARGALTAAQKAILLMLVIEKRYLGGV
jgi:hypothetical protein